MTKFNFGVFKMNISERQQLTKKILYGFANRLGVLRRALISSNPDRYLYTYYNNHEAVMVYNMDHRLLDYCYEHCKMDSDPLDKSNRYDLNKLANEMERRIKELKVLN